MRNLLTDSVMQLSSILLVLLLATVEIAAQGASEETRISDMVPQCGTGLYNMALAPETKGSNEDCPTYGPCDDPAVRDTYIPDENTPVKYITVQFNSFCTDDGGSPAIDLSEVLAHIEDLNACFEPWRIQFVYDWRYIYSSEYHTIYNNNGEITCPELIAALVLAGLDGSNRVNLTYLNYFNYIDGQYILFSAGAYPWAHWRHFQSLTTLKNTSRSH